MKHKHQNKYKVAWMYITSTWVDYVLLVLKRLLQTCPHFFLRVAVYQVGGDYMTGLVQKSYEATIKVLDACPLWFQFGPVTWAYLQVNRAELPHLRKSPLGVTVGPWSGWLFTMVFIAQLLREMGKLGSLKGKPHQFSSCSDNNWHSQVCPQT